MQNLEGNKVHDQEGECNKNTQKGGKREDKWAVRQPNLPGRIQQDSLCDKREDQSENGSGITEVKMKLVVVRADDKRQVKKEKQSSS